VTRLRYGLIQSPATDYRNAEERDYDFEIAGENLAPVSGDNMIEVVGRGPLTVGSAAECDAYAVSKLYEKVCLSYAPGLEGRKLSVKGYHPDHYEGPVTFRVHTANSVSDAKRVVFSSISEMGLRALSIGVSLVFAAIVLGMVWKGIGVYRIAGENYTPLQSFFLDKETNSYSLSKFQLLAWTTVAVFGYIYLLFCQSLIQWNFAFPNIPSGWPTLLGVSAATAVGKHPMHCRRAELRRSNILSAQDLRQRRDGEYVRVAGCIIARQRPGTAKGFIFISMEDETGIANVIVTPDLYDHDRMVVTRSKFLLVEVPLQNQDNVIHVKATRLTDPICSCEIPIILSRVGVRQADNR